MNKEGEDLEAARRVAVLKEALGIRRAWDAKQKTPQARLVRAAKKLFGIKKAP